MPALSQLVAQLMDMVRRSITPVSHTAVVTPSASEQVLVTTPASQTAVICQLALIGLQLLCRLLGSAQPQLFTAQNTTDSVRSVSFSVYCLLYFVSKILLFMWFYSSVNLHSLVYSCCAICLAVFNFNYLPVTIRFTELFPSEALLLWRPYYYLWTLMPGIPVFRHQHCWLRQ